VTRGASAARALLRASTTAALLILAACESAKHAGIPGPAGAKSAPTAAAPPATLSPPGAPAPAPARPDEAPVRPVSAKPSLELLEITTGHVGASDPAPLVVALHGLGDRPDSFADVFQGLTTDARIVLPHSKTRYSDGWAWFPPGAGTSDLGAPALLDAANTVATFIDEISAARPTLGRPIVMGFSQGGALAFTIATHHAASVGSAIAIGGWLPMALLPTARPPVNSPPILALHGTADVRVPFGATESAVARLSRLGYPVELHPFEGVGHSIPPAVRQALFERLAEACDTERRRGPRPR